MRSAGTITQTGDLSHRVSETLLRGVTDGAQLFVLHFTDIVLLLTSRLECERQMLGTGTAD